MSKGTIEKVAMAVQISGKIYYVNLAQDRLRMVAQLAASLCDSGKLEVFEAPEGTMFETTQSDEKAKEAAPPRQLPTPTPKESL